MYFVIPKNDVFDMLCRQINSLFSLSDPEITQLKDVYPRALERLEKCFSHVKNKYYWEGNQVKFDALHGCQWTAFLYFVSNEMYRRGVRKQLCDKVYALLKALSSADLFYQVELPEVFTFDHPMGSVIGRGTFSNYFTFSQGCTVGNNHGIYPTFGENVFMLSNAKVIGNCHIGDYVVIGANAYIKDTDIPNESLVFGQSPNLIIKENRKDAVVEWAQGVFYE